MTSQQPYTITYREGVVFNFPSLNATSVNGSKPLVKTALTATPSIEAKYDDTTGTFSNYLKLSEHAASTGNIKALQSVQSDGLQTEVQQSDIWNSISASTPITFDKTTGTIGVITGSTAGTVVAGNDARLSYPLTKIVKKGVAGPGEYTSVKEAVDSKPDDGSECVILIYPGEYLEEPFHMKNGTFLVGIQKLTSTIRFDSTKYFDKPCIDCTASNQVGLYTINIAMTEDKAPAPGNALVYTAGGVILHTHQLCLGTSYIGIDMHANVKNPFAPFTNLNIFDLQVLTLTAYPINTLIRMQADTPDGVNHFPLLARLFGIDNSQAFIPVLKVVDLSGPGVMVACNRITNTVLNFAQLFPIPSVGVSISDGVLMNMTQCNFNWTPIGIQIPAGGVAPQIQCLNTIIWSNNGGVDLDIQHPGVTGVIQGVLDLKKCNVQSDQLVLNFVSSDITPANTGIVSVGRFTMGANVGELTDVTDLITNQTMGIVEGGVMSDGGGLVLNVSAGIGYCRDPQRVYRVQWDATTITLPDETTTYVYVNQLSQVVSAPSRPSTTLNVLLGRVHTCDGNILLIDQSVVDAKQMENRIDSMLRDVFGSMVISGGNATVNGSWNLAVTAAKYYYASILYNSTALVAGGNFQTIYYEGSNCNHISGNTVNHTQWNDTTFAGGLRSLTAGYFVKHRLFVISSLDGASTTYFLVMGTQQFSTAQACEDAVVQYPSYFSESVVPLADLVVQQGNASIYKILDVRPTPAFTAQNAQSNVITKHSDLLGLAVGNDHPQYLLRTAQDPMLGHLDMNSYNIVNVGQVDGVDVSAHASRHIPSGPDALPTDVPISIQADISNTNTEGIAPSFARSDHRHRVEVGINEDIAGVGTINGAGVSQKLARADHVHAHGDQMGGTLHAVATQSTAGFMSAADKAKLDSLQQTSTINRAFVLTNNTPSGQVYDPAGTGSIVTAESLITTTNNVVISTNTTLDDDLYCQNLTINAGVTLNTGGYRIFASGTLNLNGTISRDGMDATYGAYNVNNSGDALAAGTLGGSAAGGAAGNGSGNSASQNTGVDGGQTTAGLQVGGVGGAGGGITGDTSRKGGAVRTVPSIPSKLNGGIKQFLQQNSAICMRTLTGLQVQGGDGGSGGAVIKSCNGGAGGSGGGIIMIAAKTVVGSGKVSARGGAGANAYSIVSGGGAGGGGGGGGGSVVIVTQTAKSSTAITIDVSGGAGGIGLGKGQSGAAGAQGTFIWLQV